MNPKKIACVAAILAVLTACTPTKPPTLYDRLGGLPAIEAVVGDFLANVAADPVINKRFARTNIPKLRQNLIDQICQASGGPCVYKGQTMLESHKGMDITDRDFDAMVGDLVKSLDKFKVAPADQQQLLTLLGGMRGDIVGH